MKRPFVVGWALLPLFLAAEAPVSAMNRTEGPCDEISVGAGTVRVDEPHLKLPEGDRPLDTAFHLKGRRGATLDFKGRKLLFHGKVQPFLLDGCQDVTIRNVTICHARSPFSEGRIVELGPRRIKLDVGPEFPYEVRDGELVFCGEGWTNIMSRGSKFFQVFDGRTGQGKELRIATYGANVQNLHDMRMALRPSAEDGFLVLTRDEDFGFSPSVGVGDRVVMQHETRDVSSFLLVNCRNVTLENVRIVNGFGMGVLSFHCRNLTLDRVVFTEGPDSPSVAANANDGIHAIATSGALVLKDCRIEGTLDDALNVHGVFFTVKSVSGDRLIADTRTFYSTTQIFLPGDRIRVTRGFTLDAAAEYEIVSTRPLSPREIEFTLDRPVAAHAKDDAIENLTAQCALTIRGCRFGKANTHLRFQTRGKIIVEDTETELPFLLTGDMSHWFESSPCESFTARNVRFTTPRAIVVANPEFIPTETSPHYHGDLAFENCSFVADRPFRLKFVRSIAVRNCRRVDGGSIRMELTNCGPADAQGCTTVRKAVRKTSMGTN